MGSPFWPVLANIFMVHLEINLLPVLGEKVPLWSRYVDDTFTFIKEESINDVTGVLNSFHHNIDFTHEIDENKCISNLDVKIIRNDNSRLSRDVFGKETDTIICLHWKTFMQDILKIGTLKGLFRRAFMICSEGESFEKEIAHLKFVFTKINKYPTDVVEKTSREVREKIENTTQTRTVANQRETNTVVDSIVTPHVILPYIGKEGHKIVQGI